jgi:phosphatidylglycerophosphatase A
LLLITGLGLGRLRPAPGTIGSLPPALLAMTLAWLLAPHISVAVFAWTVNIALLVLGVMFFSVCIVFGEAAERRFGTKDPPLVVADEIAGQSIALLLLPWRSAADANALIWNLTMAATAFVAFRLTDVLKPPPARALQSLPAGWGIVVDDLIAGVYALLITQLATRLLWPMLLG